MGVIKYSKTALQDLKAIYNYISRDSIFYAKREAKLIRLATSKLKTAPLIGKKFEKYDDENIRELIFKNYRIIYEIESKQIVILTIHHHSRSISNNPAFRDEE